MCRQADRSAPDAADHERMEALEALAQMAWRKQNISIISCRNKDVSNTIPQQVHVIKRKWNLQKK